LVIIIAGYKYEIDCMLDRNPGLKSRFTQHFDFKDWEASDCLKFLIKVAETEGFKLETEIHNHLIKGFKILIGLSGWANGRDVKRLWNDMKDCRATRIIKNGLDEDEPFIIVSDAEMAISEFIRDRSGSEKISNSRPFEFDEGEAMSDVGTSHQQTVVQKNTTLVDETVNVADIDNDPPSSSQAGCDGAVRDYGVSDEDWEALEQSKKDHIEKLARMKREMEEAELEAASKKEHALQKKLRAIGNCPMGFAWYKQGGGWRCGGGSHYVSDSQLNSQFGHDMS
jgi:hypothetical protein